MFREKGLKDMKNRKKEFDEIYDKDYESTGFIPSVENLCISLAC
jgi:hypothetical protein